MLFRDTSRDRAILGLDEDDLFAAGRAWHSLNDRLLKFGKGKKKRRPAVVVSTSTGPLVTFRPRSTQKGTGTKTAAHSHTDEYPSCWVDKDGRIPNVFRSVSRSDIPADSYMCAEPDDQVTQALLGQRSQV